jgi:hypothetical protein
MLNDFYPIRIVAPQLHYFDGVFYFMKYTTQTRVEKNYCIIEVYRDHEWWLTYDFHLDKLYYDNQGRNIYSDLECKHWGTPENIQEIDNSILKNLLSRNHV